MNQEQMEKHNIQCFRHTIQYVFDTVCAGIIEWNRTLFPSRPEAYFLNSPKAGYWAPRP